jgi:hypothetical protein
MDLLEAIGRIDLGTPAFVGNGITVHVRSIMWGGQTREPNAAVGPPFAVTFAPTGTRAKSNPVVGLMMAGGQSLNRPHLRKMNSRRRR